MKRLLVLPVLCLAATFAWANGSQKTAPAKAVPAKAAPTKTAPVKTAPVKTIPTKAAPAKTAPAKTAPAKAVPTKAEPVKTAPAKTAPVKTVPAKTVPVKAVPAKTAPTSKPSLQGSVKTPDKAVARPSLPKGSHLEYLVNNQTLRICTRADIPPFGYFKGNKLVGFEVALGKEIAAELSIRYNTTFTIRWVVVRAEERITALKNDRCDISLSAFSITASRAKEVSFSYSYLQTKKVILGFNKITNKNPLVAYVKGSTTPKNLIANGQMSSFATYYDILDAMNKGVADYVVTDHPVAVYLNRKVGSGYSLYKILNQNENYGVGVNKQNTHLLAEVNHILNAFFRNGRISYLKRTWIR